MRQRLLSQLTYANVTVTLLAFVVLGGGAYAAFRLPRNSVRSRNIVNEQVKKADLKPAEAFHKVGASGQPPFGNGGQGDCIWGPPTPADLGGKPNPFNRPAFYKDPYGVVHLTGLAIAHDGPGGDGMCGDPGDKIVFRLPPADRPPRTQRFVDPATQTSLLITGENRGLGYPAGTVWVGGGSLTSATLDPLSFRAAGAGTGLTK
jgi:hypothetical protein